MKIGFIKEGKLLILYKLVLVPLETTSQATSSTTQGVLISNLEEQTLLRGGGTARQQRKVLVTVDTGVGVREQHVSKHLIKPVRHQA